MINEILRFDKTVEEQSITLSEGYTFKTEFLTALGIL
jgi:hypothetical protein